MGWASSADYMQGTTMFFKTLDEAVGFVSDLPIRLDAAVLDMICVDREHGIQADPMD